MYFVAMLVARSKGTARYSVKALVASTKVKRKA